MIFKEFSEGFLGKPQNKFAKKYLERFDERTHRVKSKIILDRFQKKILQSQEKFLEKFRRAFLKQNLEELPKEFHEEIVRITLEKKSDFVMRNCWKN